MHMASLLPIHELLAAWAWQHVYAQHGGANTAAAGRLVQVRWVQQQMCLSCIDALVPTHLNDKQFQPWLYAGRKSSKCSSLHGFSSCVASLCSGGSTRTWRHSCSTTGCWAHEWCLTYQGYQRLNRFKRLAFSLAIGRQKSIACCLLHAVRRGRRPPSLPSSSSCRCCPRLLKPG